MPASTLPLKGIIKAAPANAPLRPVKNLSRRNATMEGRFWYWPRRQLILGTVELVSTLGYYCLVSLTLNAFELGLPDAVAPELNDPDFPASPVAS
jgi:hypothetical protein